MKLLGWMQHKLRRNSVEPFKDATTGSYCTCFSVQSSSDEDSSSKPTVGSKYGSRYPMQSKQEYENSLPDFEVKEVENYNNEVSTVIPELFHGFLTIGTLGSESIIGEPATPTFTVSWENITEERTDVTENDLKFINDELEKFFEAEAEEEGSNESSGRSSQVSTITLSGKPLEGATIEENRKVMICPLQEYLFRSTIELPETRNEVKKEKTSLAEQFWRTKLTDENPTEHYEKEDVQEKQTKNSGKHLMKILKKLHPFPGSSPTSKETNSISTKKKLQKVIQMFHRKVYPENSTTSRKFKKSSRFKTNQTPYDEGQVHNEKSRRFPKESMSKEGTKGDNSSGNGEHWIKTDAHYLVLEL